MKPSNIIIAHPNTSEQLSAIKAFMEALKIKFEVSKAGKSAYNDEFVEKIAKSRNEFRNGKHKRIDQNDMKRFLGLV